MMSNISINAGNSIDIDRSIVGDNNKPHEPKVNIVSRGFKWLSRLLNMWQLYVLIVAAIAGYGLFSTQTEPGNDQNEPLATIPTTTPHAELDPTPITSTFRIASSNNKYYLKLPEGWYAENGNTLAEQLELDLDYLYSVPDIPLSQDPEARYLEGFKFAIDPNDHKYIAVSFPTPAVYWERMVWVLYKKPGTQEFSLLKEYPTNDPNFEGLQPTIEEISGNTLTVRLRDCIHCDYYAQDKLITIDLSQL